MKLKLDDGTEIGVFIQHGRLPEQPPVLSEGQTAKGRTTTARVDYGGLEVSATAACAPADNFCRKTGIQIALARALKSADVPKAVRTQVWSAVFHHKYVGRSDRRTGRTST